MLDGDQQTREQLLYNRPNEMVLTWKQRGRGLQPLSLSCSGVSVPHSSSPQLPSDACRAPRSHISKCLKLYLFLTLFLNYQMPSFLLYAALLTLHRYLLVFSIYMFFHSFCTHLFFHSFFIPSSLSFLILISSFPPPAFLFC